MQLFENDAAIVTGAGNGIGRSIAKARVREGVNTLFADINADTVTQAAAAATASSTESIGSISGLGEVHTWVGDLSEDGACDEPSGDPAEELVRPTVAEVLPLDLARLARLLYLRPPSPGRS